MTDLPPGPELPAEPLPYTATQFRKRLTFAPDYEILAGAICETLKFSTFLDVGCGNGLLLAPLLDAGKWGHGIELSKDCLYAARAGLNRHISIGDFSEAGGGWDLVICVEVAEHILPDRSFELVTKLTQVAEDLIYFTAAPPGQPGHGHINCRPMAEWIEEFAREGWVPSRALTKRLVQAVGPMKKAPWLPRNSQVLRRKK